ncbi:MAG: DUF3990 domain-containing protein [Bacteroidales bacterium]|jgi:hypothetical protein|nr:DUF3990 domain-containing protein [Bacteroidales bacterium]
MTVYHGSNIQIFFVNLQQSEPHKDFGQGFYVTKYYKQAEAWAIRRGLYSHKNPVVSEFNFNEFAFQDKHLKTLRFDGYTDEWFDFVIFNRKKDTINQHDYDIIEGCVADDKIQNRIDRFLLGRITKEQFFTDLIYNPSHQICFHTRKGLQYLDTTHQKHIVFDIEDLLENIISNLSIDKKIDEEVSAEIFYTSKTYENLGKINLGIYKKQWQDIYSMLQEELQQNKAVEQAKKRRDIRI